jgi:hypothetical protein
LAHVRWVISDTPAGEGPGKFWSKASGWSPYIVHAVIYPSRNHAAAAVAADVPGPGNVIRVRLTFEEVIE